MKPIGSSARIAENGRSGKNESLAWHAWTARRNAQGPIGSGAAGNFLTLLVEQENAHVLGVFQIHQVLPDLAISAFLVSAHRIVERGSAQRVPRRITSTKVQLHQHGQHDKKRLRHPERQKNSQEQTLHVELRTFSRGRAKM